MQKKNRVITLDALDNLRYILRVLKLRTFLVPEGRQPIAWGVSPRKTKTKPNQALKGRHKVARSHLCRPFRAWSSYSATIPGAHAPGYRLSPLPG